MNKIIMALSVATFLVSISGDAYAFERKRVEMKCYVELLGGSYVVHYATIPEKKIAKLEKSLVKQKIVTVGKREKQEINKVTECVEKSVDFKNFFARELEKKTLH
ncbi:TapY2 family type IVa secretion system protein [Thalassotalea fusca]